MRTLRDCFLLLILFLMALISGARADSVISYGVVLQNSGFSSVPLSYLYSPHIGPTAPGSGNLTFIMPVWADPVGANWTAVLTLAGTDYTTGGTLFSSGLGQLAFGFEFADLFNSTLGWLTFEYDGYIVREPLIYSDRLPAQPIAPIPEPSTLVLLGTGLLALAGRRWKCVVG